MMDREYSHYLDGLSPSEIAEYLKDMFPEFGGLDVEEVLLQQESAYHYIENNRHSDHLTFDYGQSSSVFFPADIESSHGENTDSQLALDEALARALELGDEFNNIYVSEPAIGNIYTTQNHIDPDTMTYEELQSLGESVGNESKGLTPEVISRLPTFKYKARSISMKKKREKEECVICCNEYKKGAELTTLPCAHHYHSDCIIHWLQLKKHCPVCQKEVRDE